MMGAVRRGHREMDRSGRAALLGSGAADPRDGEDQVGLEQVADAQCHLARTLLRHHRPACHPQHAKLDLGVVGDDGTAVPLRRSLAAAEDARDRSARERLGDGQA